MDGPQLRAQVKCWLTQEKTAPTCSATRDSGRRWLIQSNFRSARGARFAADRQTNGSADKQTVATSRSQLGGYFGLRLPPKRRARARAQVRPFGRMSERIKLTKETCARVCVCAYAIACVLGARAASQSAAVHLRASHLTDSGADANGPFVGAETRERYWARVGRARAQVLITRRALGAPLNVSRRPARSLFPVRPPHTDGAKWSDVRAAFGATRMG